MKPGDLVMVRRNLPGAGGFAVVLDWDPGAGAIGYELQVATNSDFTSGAVLEDRTGAGNRVFERPQPHTVRHFSWNVYRACGGRGVRCEDTSP
jgi:hypothetical protein